jgi:hypothetical protein
MSESLVLRQAQADAAIFETFSSHQQMNLLREFHHFVYHQSMYNFHVDDGDPPSWVCIGSFETSVVPEVK